MKAALLMDAAALELFVPVVSCILERKAIAPNLATRAHHPLVMTAGLDSNGSAAVSQTFRELIAATCDPGC